MTYNEKKKAYNQEYTKNHYKRIPLDVQLSKYEQIKAAADSCNEKVNEFIKKAIDTRLDSMPKHITVVTESVETKPIKISVVNADSKKSKKKK